MPDPVVVPIVDELDIVRARQEGRQLAKAAGFGPVDLARIATASFMAYALGQILDVHVFNRLRQSRRWWLAPTASTLFGNVSDTLAFFFIAFWRSPDAFMAEHWMEIALVDYCFKVLISIVFFLPMYGVLLNMLLKRLADKSEINALQAS